jgi:hypothetical protein
MKILTLRVLHLSKFVLLVFFIQDSYGQQYQLRVDADFKTGQSSEFDKLVVSGHNAQKKGIAATLLLSNLPLAQLESDLRSECSMSRKWLLAWHKIEICSVSKLIQNPDLKQIHLDGKCLSEFVETIESSGAILPEGWRKLLVTGAYLRNGAFDPFAAFELPETQGALVQTSLSSRSMTVSLGDKQWTIPQNRSLKNHKAIGLVPFKEMVLVLFEDDSEAWSYSCAKLQDGRLEWVSNFDSYWTFPEGGNSYLEMVVADDDKVFIFCALPSSLSINCLDLSTGACLASFATARPHLELKEIEVIK